jgi:hypothetical protein
VDALAIAIIALAAIVVLDLLAVLGGTDSRDLADDRAGALSL